MLGSLILYLKSMRDNDVPTFWLLVYRGLGFIGLRRFYRAEALELKV